MTEPRTRKEVLDRVVKELEEVRDGREAEEPSLYEKMDAKPPGKTFAEVESAASKLDDVLTKLRDEMARLGAACLAFSIAYEKGEKLGAEIAAEGKEYTRRGTGDDLDSPPNTAVEGQIKGKSFVLEVVDELVAESPPEAVSDPGCV